MAGAWIFRIPALYLALVSVAGHGHETTELYNFRHYSVSEGLPESRVYAVAQDSTGYLWIGTLGGLARYNGRTFTRYTSADGLSGNQIIQIATGEAGPVWVGTRQGLCRRENRSFACPALPELDGLAIQALSIDGNTLWVGTDRGLHRLDASSGRVVDVELSGESIESLEPHDGRLWIGTGSGLRRKEPGAAGVERVETSLPEGVDVTSLLAVDARLWIGTEAGLYLRSTDGSIESVVPNGSILNTTRVSGIVPDGDGNILFGTYRGLYRVEAGGDGQIVKIQGLHSEVVRSIFRDREGIVWVGLDTGLDKWLPGGFRGYDRNAGLLADFVRAIAQDPAGRIWLGTRVGAQVVPLRGDRPAFEETFALTRDNGLANDRIYAIAFPRDGEALLATNHGVAHWHHDRGVIATYTTDDGLPDNHTRSLLRDGRGRIWVGTVNGVAVADDDRMRLRVAPGLEEVYSLDIEHDRSGRIWFATRDHGLIILGPDGRISRIDDDDGFSDQALWDLARGANDQGMWVGTNGDGLFYMRPDGSVAVHLTERDGLANNFVWSVAVDGNGAPWAYTTRGLSRYDGNRFTNYDESDGLRHLEGVATAALRDRSGRLWFASIDGLINADPHHSNTNTVPPPVRVESVSVSGKTISVGDRLPPNHSEITFEFAALTYQSEANTRYRYRLVGLSSRWRVLESYRPVTYARLRPGRYEFQVLGANADGTWSAKPGRFAFSVSAPVWQAPWFISLCALGLIGLSALAVRMRMRGLRQRTATLEWLVGERTRELEHVNRQLLQAATTDTLTGLKNRRFLMEQIEHDIAHCLRQYRDGQPEEEAITFIVIDLDEFKTINDNHGHHAGDAVLRLVGRVLASQARESDYVIRWGGDEFLVVARHGAPDAGPLLAERILVALGDTRLDIDGQRVLDGCRASIGICTYPFALQPLDVLSWEQIVEVADAAVYLSKRDGGNRWTSIEAIATTRIESARKFLANIRSDPEAVEKSGQIRIASDTG